MHLKPIRTLVIVGAISLLGVIGIFAADPNGVTLHASVKSVDKAAKTVTLSVESMHDITSFIQHGDDVEIVIEEDMASTANQSGASNQKRSWRMQRTRPMVQDGK